MLPKAYRLKDKKDFRRGYQKGKTIVFPYFVLYYRRSTNPTYRVGFSVSKKIGGAVLRNKIKRRFREICRLMPENFIPGYDYIFVVRISAKSVTRPELANQIKIALKRCCSPKGEVHV